MGRKNSTPTTRDPRPQQAHTWYPIAAIFSSFGTWPTKPSQTFSPNKAAQKGQTVGRSKIRARNGPPGGPWAARNSSIAFGDSEEGDSMERPIAFSKEAPPDKL